MVLDDIDRRLLSYLQEDGAMACADLGGRVGLSGSSINDRLRKLRARGVLRRLTAEIDPAALGLDLLAFVLVVVEADEAGFRRAMAASAEVLECHHVTGEFSYLLKLRLEMQRRSNASSPSA
jgi:Lrp/AsnC family leucine-responsive transcriptional regulator